MSSKRILIVFLVMAIGLVVAFFSLGLKKDDGKTRKKRISPMYKGLPVKTIKSKSVLTSANGRLIIPSVLQGDLVEHDIVIENRLNVPLQLKKVKSCCGFLLNYYSRQIPKNEKGKISLLVITDQFGGKTVKGKITAETNDPQQTKLNFEVSLQVKEFATVTKHIIDLQGTKKEELIGESTIIPLAEYPFNITGLKVKKGYFFDYKFTQKNSGAKREYVITVTNTAKKATIYRDMLYIQTDHPARPELLIRVKGKISE